MLTVALATVFAIPKAASAAPVKKARLPRRALLALAALVLPLAILTAPPANATYPTSSFYVTWGQTVVKGTVTWFNLGVSIDGTIKVPKGSGCRWVYSRALNGADDQDNRDPFACESTQGFRSRFSTPVAGGFTQVEVGILLNRDDFFTVNFDRCIRGHDACSTVA
jgi:hypothetical protein